MQVQTPGSFPVPVIDPRPAAPGQADPEVSQSFEKQLGQAFQAKPPSRNSASQAVHNGTDPAPLVELGTVTSDQPTVSHLLVKHPDYASKCWQIVHSEVNSQKPFTKIPEGARIAYNQQSQEIVWKKDDPPAAADSNSLSPVSNAGGADRLSLRDSTQSIIEQSVVRASAKYGLSQDLIRGVIKAESDFQPQAVSPAGAQGLMQLMPATARELGVKNPFDVTENIDAGARYLKKMLTLFNGDIKQALAAYNAGPRTIQESNGEIPYRETRHYVQRVLSFARRIA